MPPFNTIVSRAFPVAIANCNTDQIVPGRFLSRQRGTGFGEQLFHDLRFGPQGERLDGFALNRPEYQGAQILLGDVNFACGSSRESAVWALVDHGIRVVIAPSFGDIFFGNSYKNGLLPIVLPAGRVRQLLQLCEAEPASVLSVDLAAQTVRCSDGSVDRFAIDPLRKQLLLSGKDEIDYTLECSAALKEFEAAYDGRHDWL